MPFASIPTGLLRSLTIHRHQDWESTSRKILGLTWKAREACIRRLVDTINSLKPEKRPVGVDASCIEYDVFKAKSSKCDYVLGISEQQKKLKRGSYLPFTSPVSSDPPLTREKTLGASRDTPVSTLPQVTDEMQQIDSSFEMPHPSGTRHPTPPKHSHGPIESSSMIDTTSGKPHLPSPPPLTTFLPEAPPGEWVNLLNYFCTTHSSSDIY